MIKRQSLWILFGASLFSFLPSFFIPYLNTDEGGWALMSHYAFNGGLYRDVLDQKPPFLFQFHWLLSFGEFSLLILHFMTAAWMAAGACFLYQALQSFIDRSSAFFAALIFALLGGIINHAAFSPERIYLPFLCLGGLLALQSNGGKTLLRSLGLAFCAGLSLGAAGAIKQPAFPIALICMFVFFRNFRGAFVRFVMSGIGILVFTAFSWWLSKVPFETIWQSAYMENLHYIQFKNFNRSKSVDDILVNAVLVLLVLWAPLTIGLVSLIAKSRAMLSRIRGREWIDPILFTALLVMSIWSTSLGGRFYQNYYIALLPALSIACALGLSKIFRRWAIVVSLGTLSVVHGLTFSSQLRDKNKNWDSQIAQVIENIRTDTSPDDRIWINHAVPSIYVESNRRPAVEFIYFMQAIHHIDVCRASDELIREDAEHPPYKRLIQELETHKPKIIFWVSRSVNTCADRIRLENFPAIQKIISSNYSEQWKNALGTYYRRNL